MIKFIHQGIEYSCDTGEDFATARRVLGLDSPAPPLQAPLPTVGNAAPPAAPPAKKFAWPVQKKNRDPQLSKFAEFIESHAGKIVKSEDFLTYLEFKGPAGLGPYLRSIKTRLQEFEPPLDLDLILERQIGAGPATWLIPNSPTLPEFIAKAKS